MTNISPVGGVRPPIVPAPVRGPDSPDAAGGVQFGDMLKNCLQQADSSQQGAVSAIQNLLAGRSDDLLSAVSAMSKADLSFKLLLGVRNKVIEAYKQTLNMPL
jgi:flagellar hook-basal body complex protein FliE